MFLQTGAEFPWLPVGARVRFEQLHTMVDSRSAGKEEQRYTLVVDLRLSQPPEEKCEEAQFVQVKETTKRNKKKKGMKRRKGNRWRRQNWVGEEKERKERTAGGQTLT